MYAKSRHDYNRFSASTDLPLHQNISMMNQLKGQYQSVSRPRFSRHASGTSLSGPSVNESSQVSGIRSDRLRGIRSKSHIGTKETIPPRLWRRRHTGSPTKTSGAALGINFTELDPSEQGTENEHADDQLESMTNIKVAMMNFSDLFTSQTMNTSNTKDNTPDNLYVFYVCEYSLTYFTYDYIGQANFLWKS
jgi:hypothetical protein